MAGNDGLHVALLRGVNVGGKNALPMKRLAAIFAGLGCEHVRTLIQSGNVVFAASPSLARRVPGLVTQAISADFGYAVPVVLRTAKQMRDVVERNPFLRAGVSTQALHVGFLANTPSDDQRAALDPNRSPPDELALVGSELYLHCPNGLGRSKLTNSYFDAKLHTTTTMRNWNTVIELVTMTTSA